MNSDPVSQLPKLPPRSPESHKGDFGRALLIGGSRGMAGAIGLAGLAALRSGAGLVKLATAESSLPVVAGYEPSYMTFPLPEDDVGRIAAEPELLQPLIEAATAVGIGPGLGRSTSLTHLVRWLFETVDKPAVFDADALNALAESDASLPLSLPVGPRILTPHLGEFARLLHLPLESLGDDRHSMASEFAARRGVVLVLKGHRSLITDGKRQAINPTGNAGMATGGTGDVLTGVITALLCQGLPAFEAAELGAFVHGFAGDLALKHVGTVSMITHDLIDHLPRAILKLQTAQNA